MGAPTLVSRPSRSVWSVDLDGVPYTAKAHDSLTLYSFDVTDELPSGVTVSSVSWASEGPTLSSAAATSTGFSVRVTGTGDAVATITLSNSEVIKRRYRWYGNDSSERPSDYGRR